MPPECRRSTPGMPPECRRNAAGGTPPLAPARASGYIDWRCTICGDNGMIHGWEGTLWDRSGPESPPTIPTSATEH